MDSFQIGALVLAVPVVWSVIHIFWTSYNPPTKGPKA